MRPDPNREMMLQVALQLGGLTEQLVFVGGVTAGLLITDPGAPTVRPTQDVDVIAVIESHTEYYRLSELLRQRGFSEDRSEGAPMCRWISGGWQLDVMPTDESILGFSNRWYALAASTAETMELDGDIKIKVITAPCSIATKLEAFHGRGQGDYLGSHDLEDIIAVIEGRPEILTECAAASAELQSYLKVELFKLMKNDAFMQALPGHILEENRLPVVKSRLQALAGPAMAFLANQAKPPTAL